MKAMFGEAWAVDDATTVKPKCGHQFDAIKPSKPVRSDLKAVMLISTHYAPHPISVHDKAH